MDTSPPTLTLYTYFRSSCSCRVRTACHLKSVPVTYRYINLLQSEQKSPQYFDKINPNALVPALIVQEGEYITTITQSISILEFLEERFPSQRPLLPPSSQPYLRARVRELVNIVACDIQPPTNLRVLKRVNGLGLTNQEWMKEMVELPLSAYERIVKEVDGRYSVGDEVTLADVCLAPAVENALRWEVDMEAFPNVMRVFEEVRKLPEFEKGDWRHQEDTPEALRGN